MTIFCYKSIKALQELRRHTDMKTCEASRTQSAHFGAWLNTVTVKLVNIVLHTLDVLV